MKLAPICVGATLTVFALPALAAGFPENGITFVVPYAAGGATDIVGRVFAEHMAHTPQQSACTPIFPTTPAGTSSRSSVWRPRRWSWSLRTIFLSLIFVNSSHI